MKIGSKWVVVVSLVLTVWGAQGWASHYRLSSLDRFTGAQLDALSALDIETTEGFLVRTLDRAARGEVSERTGISELEVLAFARLCELLQIDGVGPRAASLLRAAGVASVSDLASRNPEELAQRVAEVNAVEMLTGVNPTAENLSDWIISAGQVPHHLE